MSQIDFGPPLPADFSGPVRLFPLPNLVLFPHVIQPLHIFEPRYRELTADALAGDKLVAMAVLKPGRDERDEPQPAIEAIACLGRILAHVQLPDGRYNLCLQGLARVKITRELPLVKPYRRAKVQVLSDSLRTGRESQRENYKRQLIDGFRLQFNDAPGLLDDLERMLKKHLSLAALTDILAYTLPLDMATKAALLAECQVERRAELLIEQHKEVWCSDESDEECGVFPPEFSLN